MAVGIRNLLNLKLFEVLDLSHSGLDAMDSS
jgi:hypothetical protein